MEHAKTLEIVHVPRVKLNHKTYNQQSNHRVNYKNNFVFSYIFASTYPTIFPFSSSATYDSWKENKKSKKI